MVRKYSAKAQKEVDKVLAALQRATRDLLYPSETDAPFEVLIWDAGENSAVSVRRLAGRPAREKCTSETLDDLLVDLVEEKEFANLKSVLEKTLTEVAVYRFGGSDATYYIVGTDAAGRLVALKTEAVET
jgi:hypothetical protein